MVKVEWVTGRRKALARCVAVAICNANNPIGCGWDDLVDSEKAEIEQLASDLVRDWIAGGVLACFPYEYRENDGQKEPDPITGS